MTSILKALKRLEEKRTKVPRLAFMSGGPGVLTGVDLQDYWAKQQVAGMTKAQRVARIADLYTQSIGGAKPTMQSLVDFMVGGGFHYNERSGDFLASGYFNEAGTGYHPALSNQLTSMYGNYSSTTFQAPSTQQFQGVNESNPSEVLDGLSGNLSTSDPSSYTGIQEVIVTANAAYITNNQLDIGDVASLTGYVGGRFTPFNPTTGEGGVLSALGMTLNYIPSGMEDTVRLGPGDVAMATRVFEWITREPVGGSGRGGRQMKPGYVINDDGTYSSVGSPNMRYDLFTGAVIGSAIQEYITYTNRPVDLPPPIYTIPEGVSGSGAGTGGIPSPYTYDPNAAPTTNGPRKNPTPGTGGDDDDDETVDSGIDYSDPSLRDYETSGTGAHSPMEEVVVTAEPPEGYIPSKSGAGWSETISPYTYDPSKTGTWSADGDFVPYNPGDPGNTDSGGGGGGEDGEDGEDGEGGEGGEGGEETGEGGGEGGEGGDGGDDTTDLGNLYPIDPEDEELADLIGDYSPAFTEIIVTVDPDSFKALNDRSRWEGILEYGGDVASEIISLFLNAPDTLIDPIGAVADVIQVIVSPFSDKATPTLKELFEEAGLNPAEDLETPEGQGILKNFLINAAENAEAPLTEDFIATLLAPQSALVKLISTSLFPDETLEGAAAAAKQWLNVNVGIPLLSGLPEGITDNRFIEAVGNIFGSMGSALMDNLSGEELGQHYQANSTMLTTIKVLGDIISAGVVTTKDEIFSALGDFGTYLFGEIPAGRWGTPNPMTSVDSFLGSESFAIITGMYNGTLIYNPLDPGNQFPPVGWDSDPPEPEVDPWDGFYVNNHLGDDPNPNSNLSLWQGFNGGTILMSEEDQIVVENEEGIPQRSPSGIPLTPIITDATTGLADTTVDATTLTEGAEIKTIAGTPAGGTAGTVSTTGLSPSASGVATIDIATADGPEVALTANQQASVDTVDALEAGTATAASGTLSAGSTSSAGTASMTTAASAATRDTANEAAAQAGVSAYTIDTTSYVDKVTGATVNVAITPDASAKQRNAITDDTYAPSQAAQIQDTLGYEAVQNRAITGTAAQGAAVAMLAEVGDMPASVANALVDNPASVASQLDNAPVTVNAAIAALPPEALVSAQMENLLGAMEEDKVPVWARPAVDKVNALMASRGLTTSTVGRDSLFNAIIQSALPLAQSNSEALQKRAAQNLDNQQQANVVTAQLDMTRRMANLANKQTAASQTAQMANDVKKLNASLKQESIITSADQEQQVRVLNITNKQRAAEVNAQNAQDMAVRNLGNEQQMSLANLELEAQVNSENMSAKNQEALAEMNIAATFLTKNADLAQQMTLANISNEQQMKLANLQAKNQASSDNLSAAQQTELANMQKDLNTKVKAAELATTMNVAQLSVDQERAVTNAAMVANIDLNKFNAAQQIEIANSKFMQTMEIADFDAQNTAILQNATAMASMDIANADNQTKVAVQNAANFLAMDMKNLDNKQQATVLNQQQKQQRLLSNSAQENAAKQFNATSKNQTEQFMTQLGAQIEQFNASSTNAMSKFNAEESNRMKAEGARNVLSAATSTAQLATDVSKFNAESENQRRQWNAANAQAIEQSNIAWRRTSNLADTAATNAANQQNVQNEYNISSIELSQMWQQVRDEATFAHNTAQNYQNRVTQLYGMALGNAGAAASAAGPQATIDLIGAVDSILAG